MQEKSEASKFTNIIKKEKTMAKEKKLVEAITSMDEDFAQWYTQRADV